LGNRGDNVAVTTIDDWGTTWYGRQQGGAPRKDASDGMRKDASEGMWWPAGKHVIPHGRLKQLLGRSARWHARKAVEGFVSDDLDELLQAAVSTGSAVELIAKTFCASVSPALLADKGDRDSVLMLTGQGAHAGGSALRLKSIGAVPALQVAKHLQKDLPTDLPDPIALRVRNAATHMACLDVNELRKGVIQMCRLVAAVLPLLDLDPMQFWGPHARPVVVDLLDEAKTEVARTVAAKRAVAGARLARLTEALPSGQAATLLAAISGSGPTTYIDHQERQTCPICGQQGWLACGVERGSIEYELDDDGHAAYAWVPRTAYPMVFNCLVCQLELEGAELDEFDFPSEIELEPDDDPYEGYEPDEDAYRDR